MKFWQSTTMAVAAVATALSALTVPQAAQAEKVLRGASFTPLHTTWAEPFSMFVKHLNEKGKGVLQIRALGPDAMPATEQPNALRSGLLDIIATPPGMYKQMLPVANAQDISNMSLAEQQASGGYEKLREFTRKATNGYLLTTYGSGVRFHVYLTKDIKTEDQLKGLRVRSQPIFQPFFSSLGLNTTTVSIPETYTSLERGIVSGYGFPAWGIQDLGWDKLTKVRIDPGFYNVTVNILINENAYAHLTKKEKAVLDETVSWFNHMLPAYVKEKDAINDKAQQAAHIKVVNFGPGFAKQAGDAYWRELEKDHPKEIAVLRPLLEK